LFILLILLFIFNIPLQAATFTVTNRNDSGPGSLRQAVLDANADLATTHTITFQSGLTGTITLVNGEIAITGRMTINGPGQNVLTISGNRTSRVFYVTSAGVTLQGLTIKEGGNSSLNDNGGGIYNSGVLTLNHLIMSGNTGVYGGAIYNRSVYNLGVLTLNNIIVSGNEAREKGGGIYNDNRLTVSSSTVSNNTAASYGGGIYNGSTLTVSNSTVSGNTAKQGGGMYNSSSLTMTNSTLSGNTAMNDGGGIFLSYSDFTMHNTLVAGNTAPNAPEVYGNSRSFTYSGNNLFGENGVSGVEGPTLTSNDLILAGSINTAIGPLADNGGPTQTHALVAGSPAIDAGNNNMIPANLVNDQRGAGFPRIVGSAVDIGAVEGIGTGTTTFALAVTKTGGNGSVTSTPAGIACGATCTANFTQDASVTLNAVADSGYSVSGYSGDCSSTSSSCTVTMNAAKTVTALFANTPITYALTVSKAGSGTGIVGGAGSYAAGSTVSLTATPNAGSTFAGWSPSPCAASFTMPANNLACTATFNLNTYALTLSKAGTGSGTVSGAGSYIAGETITLTATPNTGSTFAGWSPSPCAASFVMPTNNLACTATFSSDPIAGVIRQYLGPNVDSIMALSVAGYLVEFLDFGNLDTYTLLPTLAGSVRITDNQASNIILPAGLTISAAQFISTGVQFTVNGYNVTLLGKPTAFTFVFAGSPLDSQAGVRRTLAETAALFGVQVPVAGQPPAVATITGTIQPDGTLQ